MFGQLLCIPAAGCIGWIRVGVQMDGAELAILASSGNSCSLDSGHFLLWAANGLQQFEPVLGATHYECNPAFTVNN